MIIVISLIGPITKHTLNIEQVTVGNKLENQTPEALCRDPCRPDHLELIRELATCGSNKGYGG
jgi:hypothetical protein